MAKKASGAIGGASSTSPKSEMLAEKSGTRDHDSRSECPDSGNKFVAGLGSQTRPSALVDTKSVIRKQPLDRHPLIQENIPSLQFVSHFFER